MLPIKQEDKTMTNIKLELKAAAQEAMRQGDGLLYQKIMLRLMKLTDVQ